MRDKLRAQLKRHEGKRHFPNGRHKPYRDSVGLLTIGWGRNLHDRGISDEEAEVLLSNDIDDTLQACKVFGSWLTLDDVRKQVLANMVFNMGLPKVLQFEKMLAAISKKDYAEAALQMMDSRWAQQVGVRASELSFMMEHGAEP